MMEDILAAIPLGLFLAFLVGPVFFVLLETSAIKGFRAAISLDLGVVFADFIFILIAYFSTNQLLEKIKDDPALYIFGGVLLLTYGIISLLKNRTSYLRTTDPTVIIINKKNYLTLFIKGFVLNFINVGVLGFWLGLIIVFGPQLEMDRGRMTVFFGSVLATYLVIDIGKILLAKKLNKKLTPYRIYQLKRIISIVLIISGSILLIKGVFPKQIHDTIETQIERRIPTI
ncbi:MAG: lysine transporter LysE [Flavobacteriaceae bacterium CG_4_8_14_3_um_filter_34_10]|nr:LysE family transporter [Flavobacteriia bacterium]OIP52110.1 MAG: lysine transporter LysE [Flavobacteriaceae bacterium CG2_30_34_30]PIQ19347.1 MAG: lysine transporter LysE [Flavobacteriaceae bacterium CG18_big_fil_WC_8_21_14_2_50_34_36]PIV49185.1 MAG: lysine transporter LysE [Flavobacteriaceae bacterium CG02_land_8_20_14_3_00_34_13]PIX09685.1 MAG: lysine transporter LysE [Flavobacteriaceae bacterium CG_4_8_14_3_um_filter_34_10]PIZ08619.1 MAG: lysine transporter LysE [Flavobacteriaceae bacte